MRILTNAVAFSAGDHEATLARAQDGYVLKSESDAEIAALKKRVEELKSSNETATNQADEWKEKAKVAESQLEKDRAAVAEVLKKATEEHTRLVAGVHQWTAKILGKQNFVIVVILCRSCNPVPERFC